LNADPAPLKMPADMAPKGPGPDGVTMKGA
jgi:hypothetical protein